MVVQDQPFVLEALALTSELFDAAPDWVEVKIGSKELLPWEGAATWIEETTQGERSCFIQINNSQLTRFYPLEEVIAHEMVHAMRLMFDEARFEEILAYRTSKNRFRRYFGPIFSHPWEAKGFVLLMLISWIVYGFDLMGALALFSPLLMLGWGVFRLVFSQRVFAKALHHLEEAMRTGKALAVLLHSSDREIELFAKSSPEEIVRFATQQSQTCLRWRQILHRNLLDVF